jgi:hypothetical protein
MFELTKGNVGLKEDLSKGLVISLLVCCFEIFIVP